MKFILMFAFASLFFIACKKQTDAFTSVRLSSYFPLVVGKYITYSLDSTIFINFGQKDTVIHYQAQDRVEEAITDNLNRPAFRIVRYLKTDDSQGWQASNSFMALATDNGVELIIDNMRFQKLKLPIVNGFSWKGNSFIDTYSLNSEVKYLDDWDYTYDSVNTPLTIGNIKIDSTIKVAERDEFLGQDPSIPGTQYAEKTLSNEKYAKNIGLIYQEFLHWEYQGSQPGRPAYYTGYGIKLSMIDHN